MAEPLAVAVFLAVVANRLVQALIVPIYDRLTWDHFTLLYVAWLVGGLLVFASGVNLFDQYLPNATLGQLLTSIVAGGGANFIADLFKARNG